ncbi:MAG: N-acetyltransferase [Devosia sp.]|nr:N-acetyltransferase [Devosia sp.]
MTWPVFRKALLADIPDLLNIETESFPGDVISQRSWRGLIGSPAANVVVVEDLRDLFGDYVLLFGARTSIARLYSIAVAPDWRGRGIARLMAQDAIVRAVAHGATRLRLETRADNAKAQRLFESVGFTPFKRVPGYYEDGAEAIRYERPLVAA